MRVTDESIARVPRMESDVLHERYWDTLQQKCRELLQFIRDDEPGTEALAYYYTLDMRELAKYKGEPGAGQVYPRTFNVPHIAIHNHPDGSTFSINDIRPFLRNPNTMLMVVVGNNGNLFTLERTPRYEAAEVVHAYIDALKNEPDPRNDYNAYVDFIENFYTAVQKHGFIYRKG